MVIPIIHFYKEVFIGKYKTVKHFKLTNTIGKQFLTDRINLGNDRQFAKSHPKYWLKTHDGSKWTNPVTGLFITGAGKNVLFGNLERKRHLLMVVIYSNERGSQIEAYIYLNWYPFNINESPSTTAKKIKEFKGIKNGI